MPKYKITIKYKPTGAAPAGTKTWTLDVPVEPDAFQHDLATWLNTKTMQAMRDAGATDRAILQAVEAQNQTKAA